MILGPSVLLSNRVLSQDVAEQAQAHNLVINERGIDALREPVLEAVAPCSSANGTLDGIPRKVSSADPAAKLAQLDLG